MAVHNGAKYVRLAIESVLSQQGPNFELVIVDDASSDETPGIISSVSDPRIVVIRNERNIGQTRSLNLGLLRARAGLVARIDADDIYLPGKLAQQHALMAAQPDVAVCGTAAIKIDADGTAFGRFVPPTQARDVLFSLCYRVPVCHVSVMMRRDAVLGVGGYDERYRYAADYALWSTLAERGLRITNLNQSLMLYREFTQSLGAVHKVGESGSESAEIIQRNLAAFAGLELSLDDCRAIALLYFPAAGLTPAAVTRAYLHLRTAARAIYGRLPIGVRGELFATLCWSLLKQTGHRTAGSVDSESLWTTARTFRRHPTVAAACFATACGRWLGEDSMRRLKDAVVPFLLRGLRSR